MPEKPPDRGREILFEFQRIGHQVRVIAIDPITGTEVTMVADARASEQSIKRLAARKLFYVMRKKSGGGGGGGDDGGGTGGGEGGEGPVRGGGVYA